MKKTVLIISSIAAILLLIVATFNITYCFQEYGKEVEINFVTNGGNELAKQNYKYEYGSILTKFPEPEKEGYTFKGWFLDENLENKLIEMPIPRFEDNQITLYAKWEPINNSASYISGLIILVTLVSIGGIILVKKH